jgi:CRISPR/Cas system-associated exonuclease Cas4 (RecB family)
MPSRTIQYSQAKLQDYVDCPRRFQLRYVLMQPWPGVVAEPLTEGELHQQRGARFHHLVHQHLLGLDAADLARHIHDQVLSDWWETYLDRPPLPLPQARQRPEVTVTAPLEGARLVAKFDLLAIEPLSRIVVVDWKTMHKQPSRRALAARLQTRLYLYLAVEALADLNDGCRPEPEQVEMVYWFAQQGGATERFAYDTARHLAAGRYLKGLLSAIASEQNPVWPLTPDLRSCGYCSYRSLCERDVQPGFVHDIESDRDDDTADIDLEQVAEVVF